MSAFPPDQPILAAWETTRMRRAGDVAVRALDGTSLRTFGEIEREALDVASTLKPLARGAVVGVLLGNSPLWPATLLALWRRRLVPLPLGSHMESAELATVTATCGAAALLSEKAGRCQLAFTLGTTPAPDWLGRAPEFLKLTSGTTKAPRAIRFQASQLLADAENICVTMGITEEDLNFGAIPFSHSYGFSNLLTPLLCRGVPLVATQERLPRPLLDGLCRTGSTVFPGMPVFFEKLTALAPASPPSRLRICLSAGAPLMPAAAAGFQAAFGIKVHSFYGSSECGGISYDRTDAVVSEPGFVGTPLEGVSIEPRDDLRISVRSEAVGDGYYPVGEPETLDGQRFVPGDLVEWKGERMFISGRASDVINIAGRKLNPAEIEARIAALPGVRRAVVFGVPSPLRGEEPVCCLEAAAANRSQLIELCRRKLSAWQMPRDFWFVDEIAPNERGKISRRELAERYLARHLRT